jgi:uncharacterized membrane protein
MTIEVTLYTHDECELCDKARIDLRDLGQLFALTVREVDVRGDPALEKAFFERVPVVEIGGERLEAPLDYETLWRALKRAEAAGRPVDDRPEKAQSGCGHLLVVALNRIVLSFTRHWAVYLTALVLLYVGLPFGGAFAMHLGYTRLGDIVHRIYSPVCHQFAFRSWYLFGDQPVYPRERAGLDMGTFEEYAGQEPYFDGIDVHTLDNRLVFAAKGFRGSERMGWKVPLCQRDVAIYGALALFGVVFTVLQRLGVKVPYLPFWAYVLIALVPIGLDGFSQYFANPPFNGLGLASYPIRESTPFLRTLTGGLFGLGNGWLAYPYIAESMEESQVMLEDKLARAGIIKARADAAAD